jgi:thiol-disulfide isomerase/thioredoxin
MEIITMKKLSFFVLFFIFTGSLFAQSKETATFKPEKPKIGENINITYDPSSKDAILQDAKEITAEVLTILESENPILNEIKMEKQGKLWNCSFKVTNEKIRMLLFRFVSGEKTDDNGENSWDIMIYGKDNKPLENAHFFKYQLLNYGSYADYKCKKDKDAAKAELLKEKELYPNNINVSSTIWNTNLRENPGQETKDQIAKELSKLLEFYKNDESKVASLLRWFDQIDQKEKSAEIIKEGTDKNPKGKIAQYGRTIEIGKEKDFAKKAELYEKFINDFTDLTEQEKDNYKGTIIYYYTQAKDYDKTAKLLESIQLKDGNSYNSLAWPLIEKGEQLEKAVEWARKGIELIKNPDPKLKPSYLSTKSWKKNLDYGLGMIMDTYAFGLFKLGKIEEAEKAYGEAYTLDKGNSEEINERYIECLIKNGKEETAMQVASECLNKNKTTEKLIEFYRTAYTKVKGSDKGFDEMLGKARDKAKNELKEKLLKELINKPAIDFNLKSLDGKYVKLSDLKGKVIVLDFWATWCGPCKASFPTLQKMYEKYKDNPNIAILALDTWENEKGEEREKNVKKFIDENKYTFPVLFDENFVTKYGVEGIPTKFIIDHEGNIQFKSVGFLGEQKMINEMELQFEILLSDNIKQKK